MMIRGSQLTVLTQSGIEQFITRMKEHLKRSFPSQLASKGVDVKKEEQLDKFVRSGVQTAQWYGIFAEVDIQSFLEIQATLGASFHVDPGMPWVRPILYSWTLSGASKIDEINQHLLFDSEIPR